MTWTAQAEELAAAIPELGDSAAHLNGAIWAAGADPEVTASLISAALALGASQRDLFPRGTVVPSDAEMLTHVADLEHDTGELHRRARDMAEQAEAALEQAIRAAEAAEAAARKARTNGERSTAAAAHEEAMRKIADCTAALEILSEATHRLDHAFRQLQRVPDDLATVYEAIYDHLHRGLLLPHRDDFITGVPA